MIYSGDTPFWSGTLDSLHLDGLKLLTQTWRMGHLEINSSSFKPSTSYENTLPCKLTIEKGVLTVNTNNKPCFRLETPTSYQLNTLQHYIISILVLVEAFTHHEHILWGNQCLFQLIIFGIGLLPDMKSPSVFTIAAAVLGNWSASAGQRGSCRLCRWLETHEQSQSSVLQQWEDHSWAFSHSHPPTDFVFSRETFWTACDWGLPASQSS